MNHRITRLFRRALLLALAAAASIGAAQAAYVEIIADPDYGPEFPGLGWRASAGLYVPDACLSGYVGLGSTLVQMATTACTGTGPTDRPQLEDVTVYFYASGAPATPIETLVLGTYLADAPVGVADPDSQTQELIDFTVDGDNCPGTCTSLFEAQITSLHSSRSAIFSGTNPLLLTERFFTLHFNDDIAQLVRYDFQFLVEVSRSAPARLTFGSVMSDSDYRRLHRVPEPGSFALVLAALVPGLALRFRRSRANGIRG